MGASLQPEMLVGRERERAKLDGLLASVRQGLSGALLLRGEAGIGKSALLEYAVASAEEMKVSRVVGVESEMELGFAGLHQLLVPFLPGIERLPAPQCAALGSAFGLVESAPADLFLVGLATLTLLADAAAKQPVLCVVDDAHWLDQASAGVLGFVARRLLADRIAILFAVRAPAEPPAYAGIAQLQLGGLPDADASELLASLAGTDVQEHVGTRLVSETRGNPLALIELSGELTAEQLRGVSPLPQPLPLGRRLEDHFLSRVRALPKDTQALLVLASAQQSGDPAELSRAADHLGIAMAAADPPLELARLLTVAPHVAFRHPLMRSAVYHGASPREQRQAHEALATSIDPKLDADRRAWHRAAAALGPDEDVASELESSADRARVRGGWASAAALLARSAELTPTEDRRAGRELAAAQATLLAGNPTRARELLGRASPRLSDPEARAHSHRLKGQMTLAEGRIAESTSILLEAARAFAPLDVRLARDTALEALEAAILSGCLASATAVSDVLSATREMPLAAESRPTVADVLLDGFTAYVEGRNHEAIGLFRRAIGALRLGDDLRWFALGCLAAGELLDDEARRELAARWVEKARGQGALTSLPHALPFLGDAEVRAGRFRAADTIHAEVLEISVATGSLGPMGAVSPSELILMSWRGHEADLRSAAVAARRDAALRGFGAAISYIDAVIVMLDIGLGNYGAALGPALALYEEDPLTQGTQILPEIIEAGVRGGNPQAAATALGRLAPRAVASGTPLALGLLARSRALLAETSRAEGLYKEAIDHLEGWSTPLDLARARLLYGEWLRRQRRRVAARVQLRAAHEIFDSVGARAYAKRAELELLASGEHPRQRVTETIDELTPQEERIALLAREGASNQEIASQLFISASTVAYHLRKVFRKLGIHSRVQLAKALTAAHDGRTA